MSIEIVEETPAALEAYGTIPVSFIVESVLSVAVKDRGLQGMEFVEKPVTPYVKDYDAFEDSRPSVWSHRWDLSRWGILSAFDQGRRVGGAAIAWDTPEITGLAGGDHVACLWDLRVLPQDRGRGIGQRLFDEALRWIRRRDGRRLMVETQNINVPACRFYAKQGCELQAINRHAYGDALDEVQLIWFKSL